MINNYEKEKTAPEPSIGVDVGQSSNNKTNNIIPQENEDCNKEIVTNFFNTSLEEVVEKIELSLNDDSFSFSNNDINTAKIFFNCFKDRIVYVIEPKSWYVYNGKHWVKDEGSLLTMEIAKLFVLAYIKFTMKTGSEEMLKYTNKLCFRTRRESLIKDASSIAPKSLDMFDSHKLWFNCKNGTFDLSSNTLNPHNPFDYITKMSNVTFNSNADCDRWKQFIGEIMKENEENQRFLQKSFGYALSGETNLECFFIFYGSTTRNGKSTTCETMSYLFGDYASNSQARTLSKSNKDGSSPTPDIARLKGARLVTMAEPEKGLEVDVSLIKQLTGGDRYTGRFLHENPVEFIPEFKIFINTNHLPRVNDDTIFTSDRVKILPFERHFNLEEQDIKLKEKFKQEEMLSGIFNWLIVGYHMIKSEGLTTTQSVNTATQEYREESDIIGTFLTETTYEDKERKIRTSAIYEVYKGWAKDNGYYALNNKNFVSEIRKRYEVRRHCKQGNEVFGINLISNNNYG